jgi:RHS repeat-associated protein
MKNKLIDEFRLFYETINPSPSTLIPIASAILSANLSMKVYRPIYSPKTVNVTLHRIYNNYTIEKKEWLTGHQNGLQADEFDMTWNRMPSNLFFDPVPGSSHLFVSTDRFWVRWDVTDMLQQEIDQNNRDFSIIALADPLTDPCDDYYYLTLYSEEYVSNAPYLTVEYTNFTDFTSYLYDYAGNLIKDSEYYYQYNSYNQLERVRINNASGTVLEEYFYDENGDRAIKVHYFNSTVNETVYYYGDYVRVVNASGVFDTIEFYHGDKLIAERKNDSTMLFFHPDHLGSTSLITNSTGGAVDETFYEPFGAVLSGGNVSRFDYTGKETDLTDLEYFGARYYNPQIGKWTQPDTTLQDVYNPQLNNRYTFVRNNPFTNFDPDGHIVLASNQPIYPVYGLKDYAPLMIERNDLIIPRNTPTDFQKTGSAQTLQRLGFRNLEEFPADSAISRMSRNWRWGGMAKDLGEGIWEAIRWDKPHSGYQYDHMNHGLYRPGAGGLLQEVKNANMPLNHMRIWSMSNIFSALIRISNDEGDLVQGFISGGGSGVYHSSTGRYRSSSGRGISYSIESNDRREVTGGYIAGFYMSPGFAQKFKQALEDQ